MFLKPKAFPFLMLLHQFLLLVTLSIITFWALHQHSNFIIINYLLPLLLLNNNLLMFFLLVVEVCFLKAIYLLLISLYFILIVILFHLLHLHISLTLNHPCNFPSFFFHHLLYEVPFQFLSPNVYPLDEVQQWVPFIFDLDYDVKCFPF